MWCVHVPKHGSRLSKLFGKFSWHIRPCYHKILSCSPTHLEDMMPWFICQVHMASLQTLRIELPWLIVKHDSIMQVYVIYSKMHERIYRMKWHVDDSYYFKNITNLFSHKNTGLYYPTVHCCCRQCGRMSQPIYTYIYCILSLCLLKVSGMVHM